jgi:hypothetical protein
VEEWQRKGCEEERDRTGCVRSTNSSKDTSSKDTSSKDTVKGCEEERDRTGCVRRVCERV